MASDVAGCMLEERVINSIREIRKNKKRPDKNSICLYLEKKFDIERSEVEDNIERMVEEGTILCRMYDENRESYFVSENILNYKNDELTDKFQNLCLNEFSPESTLVSSFFEGGNQKNGDELRNTSNESQNNSDKRINLLTNLVYEQQRAYNELFEGYSEERASNIEISKQNLELWVENTNILSQKPKRDFCTKTLAVQTDDDIFPNTEKSITNCSLNTDINYTLKCKSTAITLLYDIKSLRKEKHSEYLALTSDKQNPPAAMLAFAKTNVTNGHSDPKSLRKEHSKLDKRRNNVAPVAALPPAAPPAVPPVFDISESPNKQPTKIDKPPRNKAHEWKDGVTLIVGDSTIGGLIGPKMFAAGEVKVKSHGGATIRDIYDHLEAHLSKKPSRLVVHIGTNDSNEKTSDEIMKDIKDLDAWITSYTKGRVRTIFSMPTIRHDMAKPTLTIKHLQTKFRNSGLPFIDNENIEKEHLSKRLLHLSHDGTKLLASNIINYLKHDY